ncbi:MAG: hypothetical protein HY318_13840, partial [Armatimonadetes bacterium]|nr:hypothetical protein [Armatimonadota bacterium]
ATFVTDNLYESVPVTQKKSQSVAPGVGAVYEIKIQNDGNRSIDTVYTGSAAVSGFTVQYFDSLVGGAEITGLVTGDGAPIQLAVGQSMDMRVVVTPNALPNAPAAESTQTITLTWSGTGTSKDVVQSETTVAALDKADLMVRNHDQTTYLADNVYEASPVLQVKAQSVAGGLKAIYELKAENDGNRSVDYVVTGTGTSSGFDVKYFDALSGGTDITSLVTGAGKTFNLAPAASREFRVEVTPNPDPNSPAVGTMKEVTVALAGGGSIDSVNTTTTVTSTDQGDLMIRNPSEVDADYATNNVYETSPSTQVRTQTVDPGTPATYLMKLQNDGNRTQTYTVVGTGDSTGWTAQYFNAHTGGTNITASVTGTGRQFVLPVAGEQLLRVEVTPSATPSSPPAAATKDVIVTCLVPDANNQPMAVDSVKAATVVNGGDKSDLMIRSKGESTYVSDNVYETTPVLQVKSQSVSVSGTVIYELRLQNDGNRSHDYKLLGTGGDSNWTVKYFDELLFGNDITSSVTTSGKTFTLASGQATEVRFEVTANPFPNAPAAESSKEAIIYLVGSTVDVVKSTTTVSAGSQADLMIRNSAETSYQGDNIFETLPSVQVREQTINPGGSAKYEVRLQNDGNTTRTFLLKAGEAGDAGWSATYKAGITNITSQVTGTSGYTTASLPPGGQIALTVEVIPDVTALAGSARAVTLKAYLDASDTTIRDAVSTVTTVTAGLTLTSPNGGEKWQRGTTHETTWLSSGNPGSDVKLDLYRSAGSGALVFDSTIVATTPNDGSYEWTLPGSQPPGENYRVKVSSVSDSGVGDESDADFQVLRAAPTVTSITPDTGNNTETVNVVIAGTGFVGGATTSLSKAGTDLSLTEVVVNSEGSQITATVDLTNAGAGEYDVVVVNPDGQSGKLLHGFTVTAGVSITVGTAGSYSLVSLPFVEDGYDPVATGLIDNNRNAALARWNPRKASDPTYSSYEFLVGGGLILPPSIRFTTVENGVGYWRKSSSTFTGAFTSRTTPLEIPIYVGSGAYTHWNLIGVPFTGSIDFASLQVLANGKTYSITDAASLGIVGNFAWKFPSASGYRLVALPNTYDGAETTLDPGLGYWFYANQDCFLRFVPPSGTTVRAAKVQRSFRSRDSNQWAVQVKARAGQCTDEFNYFGTASTTRSLADPPQAPDSGYVALSFNGSGSASASRTRDPGVSQAAGQATGQLSWEFHVTTNLSEPVEISWPDLSPAPKQFALYLQDLETSRRVYMNTQSTYRIQPHGSGAPYRFRIFAELRGADRLLIQGLNVLPAGRLTRSGNMVSFTLTQEAVVQVRILSASGRVVSQLQLPTARRGLNSTQVPLTNGLGFVLPRGFYLCEVTATTTEGRIVKAVKGFSLR